MHDEWVRLKSLDEALENSHRGLKRPVGRDERSLMKPLQRKHRCQKALS